MATPTRNNFPHYTNGDVLLIISTTQYYRLHSQVLCTHSDFFRESIASTPLAKLSATARRENLPAARFEFHRKGEGFGSFTRIVRIVMRLSSGES
jgi:hypothetical protein